MSATAEPVTSGAAGFRLSVMRRPAALARGELRLLVDPEGASRSLQSLSEGRVLFGRQQLYFFKVQAGIVVASQRPDWSARLAPSGCHLSGRVFDTVEVAQSFECSSPPSKGFTRKVRLRNAGARAIKLRVICLSDPTAAHFRDNSNWWGSLGVNAFNRETHVAMDEISEPHPARVVGSIPGPTKVYMTTDRSRAGELLQAGDVAEPTAGMSGLVLTLSLHELELAPSESKDILFASFYSPNKLEEVLSDFGKVQGGDRPAPRKDFPFACSSQRVTEAYGWALSSLEGAQFESDLLDRLEALRGLSYVDPASSDALVARTKAAVSKDGTMPRSEDPAKAAVLESSLLLSGASRLLTMSNDRRAARKAYPLLRRVANALASQQRGGSLQLDPSLPQGWRRRLGSGYPAGEVPEVSLSVAASLSDFARVARLLGKGEEAAKLRERSELIADGVEKRLVDDRGFLGLCLDSSGKLRADETLDMAVACYRYPALRGVASSGVHRLLEKDFETDFGPRTVPTSNRMYFHGAYGQGQLGGYWTRGALAFVCLSYAAGLPGMGSLTLERVSRLASEESLKLGGVPGELPYWVDVEGKEAHGDRSDPVAASRLVQAVVEGELGLTMAANSPAFNPPGLSSLKWVYARELWAGEKVSAFVGRSGGKAFAFACCQRTEIERGERFEKCEQVEVAPKGTAAVSFYNPGQVVCVGNSTSSLAKVRVTVSPKATGFSKRLVTPLEEFEPSSGTWNKIGTIRVSPAMTFEAPVGAGDWMAYRLSND